MNRSQTHKILDDLNKKMVFLVGPRQVGKTWLSKEILKNFEKGLYLNYDNYDHREIILKKLWNPALELVVFDELHKMPQWKNYLKGLFDTKEEKLKILVTGSARLETFRQAGDSLAGRFFRHRLLPFSLSELENPNYSDQDKLIFQGGFPEPFLEKQRQDADRWRLIYVDGLIRTDILDFERIYDFKAMQQLLEILRRSVGSNISFQSISEDISISPNTVKKYIQILEELFIIFRVTPYSKNISRSLVKEPKLYFYDTGMVIGDEGAKYENFVALSLLKHTFQIEDYQGKKANLKYFKTRNGQEVDFALIVNDEVEFILEAKLTDKKLHSGLNYFSNKYDFKAIQLIKNLSIDKFIGRIEIRNSFEFLKGF
ncbi:MAG: ATP-binding protein, partial [Pseudomonadota bacterium]